MTELYPARYCVEQWWPDDRGVEETLAACSNLDIARAAYQEAVRRFPDKRLYLRHRSFVVEQHEPEP